MNKVNFEYDIKCRKCGKIKRMYFGDTNVTTSENFRIWVSEHSAFPIQSQCNCDNGMMLLHDIVSFGPILYI